MTIVPGVKVCLEYTLKLDDGHVVESNVGRNPLEYTHGSAQIIPGLESALEGLKAGDTKQVELAPAEGYGEPVAEAVQEVPSERIPEDAREVGAELQAQTTDGNVLRGRVTALRGETAVVDFNHPLAGKTLHFDVKVLDVQRAGDD
jgi:FKBP-type peptidyl-prolyl cis-trans isomerase SlyD